MGRIGGSFPGRPAEQGFLTGGDVGDGLRIGRDCRFRIGAWSRASRVALDPQDRGGPADGLAGSANYDATRAIPNPR
jgi:hypothetical protein